MIESVGLEFVFQGYMCIIIARKNSKIFCKQILKIFCSSEVSSGLARGQVPRAPLFFLGGGAEIDLI